MSLQKIKICIQRFSRETRGVSAIEFALIAPVLMFMLMGSIEVSLLLTADRKITQTTSSIADLVAQDDVITSDEMSDIFTAAKAILQPYDTAPLKMRVTSITMDKDKKIKVSWSKGSGMVPRATGSSVTTPSGILQPNTSVIMSEVFYQYNGILGSVIKTPMRLHDTFYLRPRRSGQVIGP